MLIRIVKSKSGGWGPVSAGTAVMEVIRGCGSSRHQMGHAEVGERAAQGQHSAVEKTVTQGQLT